MEEHEEDLGQGYISTKLEIGVGMLCLKRGGIFHNPVQDNLTP